MSETFDCRVVVTGAIFTATPHRGCGVIAPHKHCVIQFLASPSSIGCVSMSGGPIVGLWCWPLRRWGASWSCMQIRYGYWSYTQIYQYTIANRPEIMSGSTVFLQSSQSNRSIWICANRYRTAQFSYGKHRHECKMAIFYVAAQISTPGEDQVQGSR